MGITILGFMMVPVIDSMHISSYWLLLALVAALGGTYVRSRARRAAEGGS
jgi:hypothetical protein